MGRAVMTPRRSPSAKASAKAAGVPSTKAVGRAVPSRRGRWGIALIFAAIIGAIAIFVLLPRGYGELSERGYEFALAIASACNQRDAVRIERLVALLEDDDARRELDEAERGWLRAILVEATEGRWEQANRRARRLLERQLQRAPP